MGPKINKTMIVKKEPKSSLFQSMFSFSTQASPYDELVEKATAETLTSENWGLMLNICDAVKAEGQKGSKNVLLALKKRLNHRDPHVIIYSLSLLDCLWNNAGSEFRRAVSSRDFLPELSDKANSSVRAVAVKVREIIKSWAENDCPKDASLSLISSLHKELENDGFIMDTPIKKSTIPISDDPNVVSSKEEEEAIAKAIEASLKEAEKYNQKKQVKTINNAYPSLQKQNLAQSSKDKKYREVRALYDFEEVEENELPFKTGDIIMVLEDSDQNWWKGQSHRGVGLFPSSFVTDKLETTPAPMDNQPQQKKMESLPVKIDQNILLKCLQMLDDCDPTGETSDPPDLAMYEEQANKQGPLIDRKLAAIDKQMNMLHELDISVRNVLAAYDEAIVKCQNQIPPMQFPDYKPGAPAGVFPTMPGGSMMLLQQYQYAQSQGQGINGFPGMNQPQFNMPGYMQQQHPQHMNPQHMQHQQNIQQLPQFTQQVPRSLPQQVEPNVSSTTSMHHGHNTPQHMYHPRHSNMQPQVSAVAPQLPIVQPQQLIHQQLEQQHNPQQLNQNQVSFQQHTQTSVQQSTPVNYQVPPFQPQTFIQPQPQQTQNINNQVSQTPIHQQQNNQAQQLQMQQKQQQQQVPHNPTQPQNVVPPHSATPTVPPLTPQGSNTTTPIQQVVQPHVSQQSIVPPTPHNSQTPVQEPEIPPTTTVAPIEPVMVAPIQQQNQQQLTQQAPQEPTHASVTPQRSTISVQPYEPQSEVVEEQFVSLDNPNEEPEPSPNPPVNSNVESVPVVCPVPVVPQQNQDQDNQQFILPVQPQTQESKTEET